MDHLWLWVGFNLFIFAMLAIDLGLLHRKAHEVSVREASIWSGVCVALALGFAGILYAWRGSRPALEFLTGFVIEWSLSVDNIFVFVLLFSFFSVPRAVQHRVLFWGVLGALVMRGTLIGAGTFLIHRFHWIMYIFGAFLLVTGIRMAFQDSEGVEPEKNPVIRLIRRVFPVTHEYDGARFFKKIDGRWWATPLFVVLAVVETTDLVFAVDSIPAIFAVTTDPFLVYTSNVFAIMGLRSLYFVLVDVIDRFHLLQFGLATVLTFVGVKMLIADVYKVPIGISLGIVAGVLAMAVIASLIFPKPPDESAEAEEHAAAPE
jgi:tellurite resistance protein TerC